ncbi:MAG: nucleotidyltransferase domain-containing protein [Thaumarchaeota archaeon]|nr:nucleotidyltransferase domain-containing protein [Candidatus Geocrenenecus arthurdayi]MCL7402983.1 nucleotidyltransferase domain-containing protein [Candidatus Geocrenenecus arthurdayi]
MSGRLKILEGYYVEVDGDIYAVKGVLHPPGKIIAIPIYVEMLDSRYHRIRSLREAFRYLEKNKPQYIEKLDFTGQRTPTIPLDDVQEIYDPLEFNQADTDAGRDALILKEMIENSVNIKVGVSGSILLGLDDPSSDIDLVVYGLDSGRRFIEALRELRAMNITKPVNTLDWLIETRIDSETSPEEWLKLESRKLLTGVFKNRLYTSKIVPLLDEYWENLSQIVREIGRAEIICRVVDSRFSNTTPNLYNVKVLNLVEGDDRARYVSQVMSMRSRFAEIASTGDTVEVEGRLEEVEYRDKKIYRIFIGNNERDKLKPVMKY